MLTHRISRTKEILQVHRVYYYQKLLEPFGRGEGHLSPRVFLREEDRNWAEQTLRIWESQREGLSSVSIRSNLWLGQMLVSRSIR